ncbi:MAG: hypothetical protein ABIV04_19085, partial [Massilia sp.]
MHFREHNRTGGVADRDIVGETTNRLVGCIEHHRCRRAPFHRVHHLHPLMAGQGRAPSTKSYHLCGGCSWMWAAPPKEFMNAPSRPPPI